MSAGTLLISEQKLKNFTQINKNCDIDVLRAEITITQDISLQTLLGTLFYEHLLSCVSATGNTFNADEKILVDEYISKFLIHQSFYQALPALHLRVMNRGIVGGQDSDNSKYADMETLKYLRSIQKNTADFYMTRLQDYLNTGHGVGKFPQYLTMSITDGMIPDRSQKYNSGIFLRHTTRKGYPMTDVYKGIQSYSDIEKSNPPCYDCY
jgi:hypothetical protein